MYIIIIDDKKKNKRKEVSAKYTKERWKPEYSSGNMGLFK